MNKSLWIILTLLLWLTPLLGQSEGSKKEGSQTDTPSMEEMMAAYMKLSQPGEQHAMLKPMAGEWAVDGKFRMAPDAEWMSSKSDASLEWVLGGRFLRQEVSSPPSDFMPYPFEGLGYLGYDNFEKKYVSVWMDSMGTMVLTGSGAGGDNSVSVEGKYPDPLGGGYKPYRWVYEIHDKDHFTMKMYEEGPDGNPYVHGELHYSRKQD